MKKHKFARFLMTGLGDGLILHSLLEKFQVVDEYADDYAEEDWL